MHSGTTEGLDWLMRWQYHRVLDPQGGEKRLRTPGRELWLGEETGSLACSLLQETLPTQSANDWLVRLCCVSVPVSASTTLDTCNRSSP